MQAFLTLWIVLFMALSGYGTIFPNSKGPVSLGLGNVSAIKNDPFSAYNHQGTLALAKYNSASICFQSNFFVEGLNSVLFSTNLKLNKTQTIGIAYGFDGNGYYNESLLKVGLSQKFSSSFGAGISLDYLRLQLPKESYKVKNLLTFEAGFYGTFNSYFDFAFQAINPTRVSLASYLDERLPFIINTAIIYKPSDELQIAAEWNQVMNGFGKLRCGINYKVSKNLGIMAGFYNKPINPSFGMSYLSKKIEIHIAFAYHPYLGYVSSNALTFIK